MNSKVVFGQYYQTNSFLHKLDPRVKIVGLIILMVCAFLLENIIALGCFFGFCVVLSILTKVPFGKYIKSLKMVLFVFLFTTIFQVFFNTQGELLASYDCNLNLINLLASIALVIIYILMKRVLNKFRFLQLLIVIILIIVMQVVVKNGIVLTTYKIDIYTDGVVSASRIILRIVSLLFLSTTLTLTTKPTELNNGLEFLLKPLNIIGNVQIFTMMVSIALRFIPTLINETDKILKAQASRGVDFNEGSLKEKIMQIVSLLIPIFSISYTKADDLAYAMESRGYDPDSKRTSINVLHFRLSDGIISFAILVILASVIVGKVVYGL